MPTTDFLPNLIGYIHDFAQPLFDSVFPWAALLGGVVIVFIIMRGFIDFIQDRFDEFIEKAYKKGKREGYEKAGEEYVQDLKRVKKYFSEYEN